MDAADEYAAVYDSEDFSVGIACTDFRIEGLGIAAFQFDPNVRRNVCLFSSSDFCIAKDALSEATVLRGVI